MRYCAKSYCGSNGRIGCFEIIGGNDCRRHHRCWGCPKGNRTYSVTYPTLVAKAFCTKENSTFFTLRGGTLVKWLKRLSVTSFIEEKTHLTNYRIMFLYFTIE